MILKMLGKPDFFVDFLIKNQPQSDDRPQRWDLSHWKKSSEKFSAESATDKTSYFISPRLHVQMPGQSDRQIQ